MSDKKRIERIYLNEARAAVIAVSGGRVADKNARLNHYRQIAPEVWLLLVNDLFLGPRGGCSP